MSEALLRTAGLTKEFGEITAVDDVNVEFGEGETTALIGPNGAGKTTFFNLLTGVLEPTQGEVRFREEVISGRPPHEIARIGITRSYQITNFFPGLSATENVRLAAQADETGFGPSDFLRHNRSIESATTEAERVLSRLGLSDVADRPAHNLSHGQQRHLEMGIAFARDPDLLLLDEPTAGMSPSETNDTITLIQELAEDVTIVIVEHDMNVVMDVSDRIAVMYHGSLLAVDEPDEIRENEEVQDVYLQGGN